MSQQNIEIPTIPSVGSPDETDLIIVLKGGGDSIVGSYAAATAMPDRNETQRIDKVAALNNSVKTYTIASLRSTVADTAIQETARDAIATALRGMNNISVASDDTANTITISGITDDQIKDVVGAMFASGIYSATNRTITLPATRTEEQVQDIIGAMFTGDNATYNDSAGTINIQTGGFSPKFVRFPITHNLSPSRNNWSVLPVTLQVDAATTPYGGTASTGITRESNGLSVQVATTAFYSVHVLFYLFGSNAGAWNLMLEQASDSAFSTNRATLARASRYSATSEFNLTIPAIRLTTGTYLRLHLPDSITGSAGAGRVSTAAGAVSYIEFTQLN